MKEIIICAAVKLKDGSIIRGHRHSDCMRRVGRDLAKRVGLVQGFITSQNRFVDRKEAFKLHIAAGCYASSVSRMEKQLYSEDLY